MNVQSPDLYAITPLPSSNDQTPLLTKEKGKGAMTNSRHTIDPDQ